MEIPTVPPDQADTLVVYTSKGADQIIALAASGDWRVDPNHAGNVEWLLCIQNDRRDLPEFNPTAPHNHAFLLAQVAGVEPVPMPAGKPPRWAIKISAAARIKPRKMWDGKRSPTRYTTLALLGIDPAAETFTPVIEASRSSSRVEERHPSVSQVLADAKATIASALGLQPTAVKISIEA